MLALILAALPFFFEDFDSFESADFRQLPFVGGLVQVGPDKISYVASESGRPGAFGVKSIYVEKSLKITFDPPIQGLNIEAAPYMKGRPRLDCFFVTEATGEPYPYPISDVSSNELIYPTYVQLWAQVFPIYKITHCTITNSEGMFVDNLTWW